MPNTWNGWLRILYVIFAFCSALFLGAFKGLLVGPVAGLIVVIGNVGVLLGLFPFHFAWTIYTIVNTNRFDMPLKIAILLALPALSAIWLGLSIAGSVLVGVGYGFFTPWVSAFEAFRRDNEFMKYLHCIVDGTWGTIKGSCTVVQDFADICYHSYPLWLREIRESQSSNEIQTLKFIQVPGIIIIGLMGLIVEVPSYTIIALVKSPYMLFKGWQRLIHDLITREGPFLETACIPVAGLAILLWPLIVVGSVLMSIFSSVFVGLYGSYIVYQERSFRRGAAYVIAMVAEFDEYTNDFLYLREGSIFPKPKYRKKTSHSSELSVRGNHTQVPNINLGPSAQATLMFIPNLAPSRSVRESIHDVKMIQMWAHMMRSCEVRGKELIDTNAITQVDLSQWIKAKNGHEAAIIGVGLPSYSCLHTLLYSIKSGSDGLLLFEDIVVTYENRPKDKLSDWFFQPVLLLKEQIKAIKLSDGEVRYLEKVVLFGSDTQRMDEWENDSLMPHDPVRSAQIQGISRRLTGMMRSISKFPTYRRKYRIIVKALVSYYIEKEGSAKFESVRDIVDSIEVV